jgi:zinc/manganese transport system permease protein
MGGSSSSANPICIRMLTDATSLTWNVPKDVQQLFEFHFMLNAFRAGTAIAIAAAVIGWFTVLRQQTFAGHSLAVIGFPGAAAAVWLGLSASVGFYAFCVAAALVIALVPRSTRGSYREESAVIGTLQALALASGFLFVSLYGGFLNGVTSLLFGSFLGISDRQVLTLVAVAIGLVAVIALFGRRLLFSSIDPDVAAASGVPARVMSTAFLVVLALAVAAASQITGALLVFALLVVPPAAAQALTVRPARSVVMTVAFALLITWLGLAIAFYSPYPVGFWITAIAGAVYVGARVVGARLTRA